MSQAEVGDHSLVDYGASIEILATKAERGQAEADAARETK